ncbi:MAG: metallophosphoesterase [bacterium]
MNEDLRALYQELGYTGQLVQPKRRSRDLGDPLPEAEQVPELPPLDRQGLRQIETLLQDQPEETLALIKNNFSYPLTDDIIRDSLEEARQAFAAPAKFVADLRAKREKERIDLEGRRTRDIEGRVATFPPELMLYPDIPIEPNNHKFEPMGDALGWVFNSIYFIARDKLNPKHLKARFPMHSEFKSNFTYRMKDAHGEPLAPDRKITVALFADFGTGLYHSRYIARNIAAFEPDYAFHLGDVYYAGRNAEFRYHFEQPLEPVLQKSRVFTMNSNHEMFSGAFPYFSYLNYKRNKKEGWVEQAQEASYFCIWNEKFQIIGIDTAYHEDGRHRITELNQWLGERLHMGKNAQPKRINILLSPNEPYELGKEEFAPLYSDLQEFVRAGLIDYWFWGNTHYCALFDKSLTTPFIGSCVGHGGHPIYKVDVELNDLKQKDLLKKNKTVPPTLWVELSHKFPESTGLRADLANHGFCLMELEANMVRLTYYDWLKQKRFSWENNS